MPDQIAYNMRFRGQRHVIHMKLKKNMIPENVPVYTTNDQGAEQEDHPFIPRDCYFYSYLEGVPGSLATLDTCKGGLTGMIQVDDFTYEIKPLATSSKFEHVISLIVVEGRSRKSEKCGIENVLEVRESPEEMKFAGSPRAGPTYLWRAHKKVIRVHYTMSHSAHIVTNNITHSLEMLLIINSISDTIYRATGMNVFVRALCVWEREDAVNIGWLSDNMDLFLQTYSDFKSRFYREIPHSVSTLFTGYRVSDLDYFAFFEGMCHSYWGAVYIDLTHRHIFLAASLMAHAFGHSFGIHHDTPGCVCFRRTNCVMSASPSLLDMFSNCTYTRLHNRIHGWDNCLSDLTGHQYKNYDYSTRRCGDGVVDTDEQCDCGSLKDCSHNKCCTTTCTFTQGSTCNIGACCLNCDYAAAGKRCRDKQGICDLPEYCSGTSNLCPENSYIMDGTPCSPQAVCMSGNCSDRHLQCQALFGYQVRDASPACYELNRKGDRFGNCGVIYTPTGMKPKLCEDDDIFCGLLHCDGVNRLPGGGEHTSFHHIKVQDVKEENCFGYDAHHGTNLPYPGLVVDGATCGAGKYCKGQSCVFHQTLNYACNISTCNFRGVCNNFGNCHCRQGWNPPTCDQRGPGGSENSGPPPTTEKMLQAKIHVNINRILLVVFARMLLILASLLFGGLIRAAIIIETE